MKAREQLALPWTSQRLDAAELCQSFQDFLLLQMSGGSKIELMTVIPLPGVPKPASYKN